MPGRQLRPAPFALTPKAVRRLVDSALPLPASVKVALIPVLPIKLVDQCPRGSAPVAKPRRAAKPRLVAVPDSNQVETLPALTDSGDVPARVAPAEESAPVLQLVKVDPATLEGWPDAPLPGVDEHEGADPDLDRPELPASEPEQEPYYAPDNAIGQAIPQGRQVVFPLPGKPMKPVAEERAHWRAPELVPESLPEVEALQEEQLRIAEAHAAQLRTAPQEDENVFDLAANPTRLPPPIRGKRAAIVIDEIGFAEPVELPPAGGRERLRQLAQGLAEKRAAQAAKIDWARVAKAHRRAAPAKSASVLAAPLHPAPSREECPRCGIPGWKGCAHFLPCEDGPSPHVEAAEDRRTVGFRAHRRAWNKDDGE